MAHSQVISRQQHGRNCSLKCLTDAMGNSIAITMGSEKCVNEKSDLGRVGGASRIATMSLEGGVTGASRVNISESYCI